MHYRVFAPVMLCAALCALPLVAMAGMSTRAAATPAPDTPMALDGHLLVETVGGNAEERTLHEAAEVRSGDRLIFLIRYRNTGGAALPGYDFVSPVPHGVRILPDRAGTVRVSADGGRSWSRPDSPLRVDTNGKWRPADELSPTHVRLRLDRAIAPGETGTVTYRGLLL